MMRAGSKRQLADVLGDRNVWAGRPPERLPSTDRRFNRIASQGIKATRTRYNDKILFLHTFNNSTRMGRFPPEIQ